MIEVEHHQLVLRYASLRIRDSARVGRLAASLVREGQLSPVLVLAVEDRFLLIDGYARVAALESLGLDTVRAVDLEMDETAALLLHHKLENARERSPLEDGWLVQHLVDVCGLDQEEVARDLQRSASWVSRRLALVRDLPEAVQDQVRRGRLGAHGAARYLVPLARANREDCAALVTNLGRRASSRELRTLYLAYRSGDDEARERVVSHPELLLEVAATRGEPPGPVEVSPGQEDLLRDLRMSSGILRRACRRMEPGATGELDWCESLRCAWLELEVAFRNLSRSVERRRGCARPG